MKSDDNTIKDLCSASAKALTNAYKAGNISPVEVAKATLARAESINAELNAFTTIDHEGAMATAKASEQRWLQGKPLSPVDGVPTTIKDIVHCNGFNIHYGSLVTPDISAMPDAPSVERLRKAGTVLLGVTTTPEFGWKAVTDNPRNGITRNPWDASKTPGGSSGGAGAAAASGAGVFHLGTDGGGSIRIPASFCGIVGHKPSYGRVAAYPASVFGTLANIGPMTRTVDDAALMLNVMSGRDHRDWTQAPLQPEPVNLKPIDWKNCRIAYWDTPILGQVDAEVESAIRATINDLEQVGAKIERFTLPMQDELVETFLRHWFIGAASRLSLIDEADRERLDPGLLRCALKGLEYTGVERTEAEVTRVRFGIEMDLLLKDYDYILSPTMPGAAFDAGVNGPAGNNAEDWVDWCSFTFPMNLSQQPACSLPCGKTKKGLPIGLQIIAARGADEKVLSAASTYEQMYPERFISDAGTWPDLINKNN